MSHLGEILTLKLIFQIMEQKQTLKILHVDTSSFALKTNLANLKTENHKLDIDKLVPVPADLSKLSDVVKNHVIIKNDYNAKMAKIENKIPEISNLATKSALNTVEKKNWILAVLLKRQIIILN